MGGNTLPPVSVGMIMRTVASAYIQSTPPRNREEWHEFRTYLEEVRRLIIDAEEMSSLRITVRCTSLEILEDLWQDYTSGALNEVAQSYLVTDEILSMYNLQELKILTNIDEEEYRRCKVQLTEIDGNTREHTHTHIRTEKKRDNLNKWNLMIPKFQQYRNCFA